MHSRARGPADYRQRDGLAPRLNTLPCPRPPFGLQLPSDVKLNYFDAENNMQEVTVGSLTKGKKVRHKPLLAPVPADQALGVAPGGAAMPSGARCTSAFVVNVAERCMWKILAAGCGRAAPSPARHPRRRPPAGGAVCGARRLHAHLQPQAPSRLH